MRGIDLSALSLDELKALRRRIDKEIEVRRQAIGLKPGDKVRHPDFPERGIGTVEGVSPTGRTVRVKWRTPLGYGGVRYYYPESLERVEGAQTDGSGD